VVKGGQVLSYRALVVVGNINGCAGWGVGKGENPDEARFRAYRDAKKNLIHVDLYRNRCVTTALYGKHNNCRVYIQPGNPAQPNKEGRMINDILKMFGVECGEAKSIGRRNPYSVVRAVFNAMSKHQGVEEVSRKRGRRLISVSKARELGL
jgi:small subunit ribosomal protein S5